jgi:HSP20 family protein
VIEMATATRETTNGKVTTPQETQPQTGMTTTSGAAIEQTSKQELQTQGGSERTRSGRAYLPAADIYETNNAVVLVLDMPGVDEGTVDVTLEKNVLTIYGRVEPQLPVAHTLAYREYGIGDYQRSFTISNQIDWEKIEGTVKNGVLRLTLPKAGPAKAKQINIKSG